MRFHPQPRNCFHRRKRGCCARDFDDARKPPLSAAGILLMNFGFFGIQYSFGLQQSAVDPIFTSIGADPHDMPLLNLAGPVTG